MMPFAMFVQNCQLLDSNLNSNDVTLKFAATTTNMIKKDNYRNP